MTTTDLANLIARALDAATEFGVRCGAGDDAIPAMGDLETAYTDLYRLVHALPFELAARLPEPGADVAVAS